MGSEPTPASTADRASRWSNRLELVVGLTSLLVAVAYVALRFAYTRFYDALGVAPEEVGLGQVDLLVRSVGLAVVFVVMGALALELVAVAVACFLALRVLPRTGQIIEMLLEDLKGRPKPSALLVGVGIVSWVGLPLLPRTAPGLIGYVPFALVLTGAVLMYRRRRGLTHLVSDARATRQTIRLGLFTAFAGIARWWKVGAATVTAASVVLLFALVALTAPNASRLVQEGRAYRDWAVPWRADPATVYWIHQRPADDPLSGRCLMYLGHANGIAVLYDARTRRVVRVPSGEVVVLIETSADRCPRRP